jgi:hypothetical protein
MSPVCPIRILAIHQARKRSGRDFQLACAWASSALTDIHHQGHSPGKDVQNGDEGTAEAGLGDLVACVERETAVRVLRAVVVVLVIVPPSSTF